MFIKYDLKQLGIDIPPHVLASRILIELAGFAVLLIPSLLTLYFTDFWIEKGRPIPLLCLLLVLLGTFCIHLFRFYFVNYRGQVYANRLACNYRLSFASKIAACDIPSYEQQPKGKLMNMMSDVSGIYTAGDYFVVIPADLIKAAAVVALLFYAHRDIALVSIVLAPLYIASSFLNRKHLEGLVQKERLCSDRWYQEMDTLVNYKVSIALNHVSDYILRRHGKALEDFNTARNRQHFFLLITQELPRWITTFAPLAVLIVGGNQVAAGAMSIGQLLFALQVIPYLFTPLSEISVLHAQFMSQYPTFERIKSFLSLPDQKAAAANAAERDIWLENAELLRPDGTLLFRIPTFEAGKPGLTLIRGDNGCGKSSLFNVLAGVYPATQLKTAVPTVGGATIGLADGMGYLFYPNFIFSGTVRENVLCGRDIPAGRYAEIEQALRLPPAGKEVKVRPENLSLGEKQKIYLARLLLGDFDVLLLDEPGSNLDIQTEQALVQLLAKLKRTKRLLVISHNELYNAVADQQFYISGQEMCATEE